MGGAAVKAKDIGSFGRGAGGDLIDIGMGAGAGGLSGATMGLDHGYSRWGEHIEMERVDGGMTLGHGHYSDYRGGAFDGMALSSEFLGEYYSNVST